MKKCKNIAGYGPGRISLYYPSEVSYQNPEPRHKHDWNACEGSNKEVNFSISSNKKNKRKKIRCPNCNRRLLPYSLHCVGGEFISWMIPRHKSKQNK